MTLGTMAVLIGTTSAAGAGITLTAANYAIFASLPGRLR